MKLIIPFVVLCLMATINTKAQSSLDINKRVENQDLESNKLDNPVVLFQKTKQDKTLYFYVYEESDKKDHVAFETVVETADRIHVLSRVYLSDYEEFRYFYDLVDFAVYQQFIYIIHNSFGDVYMEQYDLSGEQPVFLKKYTVDRHGIISFANAGGLESRSESKWIDGNLYFYIYASQDIAIMPLKKLYLFDRTNIFEIRFSMEHAQIIKVLQINIFGKSRYERYLKTGGSDIPATAENKERYAILSRFYDKPYGYWLSTEQEDIIRNAGLERHPLITVNEEKILSAEQLEVATKSLKHVLLTYCNQKLPSSFRIIEYIYNQQGRLFFFYKNSSGKMQIAMYNLNRDEWIIDEYRKKDPFEAEDDSVPDYDYYYY